MSVLQNADVDSLSLEEAVQVLAQKRERAAAKAARNPTKTAAAADGGVSPVAEGSRAPATSSKPSASKRTASKAKPRAGKQAVSSTVEAGSAKKPARAARAATSAKRGRPAAAGKASPASKKAAPAGASQKKTTKRSPSAHQRFKSQHWDAVKAEHADLTPKEVGLCRVAVFLPQQR